MVAVLVPVAWANLLMLVVGSALTAAATVRRNSSVLLRLCPPETGLHPRHWLLLFSLLTFATRAQEQLSRWVISWVDMLASISAEILCCLASMIWVHKVVRLVPPFILPFCSWAVDSLYSCPWLKYMRVYLSSMYSYVSFSHLTITWFCAHSIISCCDKATA